MVMTLFCASAPLTALLLASALRGEIEKRRCSPSTVAELRQVCRCCRDVVCRLEARRAIGLRA